ncbi:MAG: 4Fe-4S dicluster domain-containing protein [Candidatus Bathyarchaeia archaeon]
MAKAVLVDLRRCIGCRSCQVACKRWNDRGVTATKHNPDPKFEWTNPSEFSPQTYTYVKFVKLGKGESLKWVFAKVQCNHCIEPGCATACPTTALIKTKEGPVIYRKELCIGCGYCINACPFNVPKFDEENKAIEKCTFCSERLTEGLEPACVQACPTDTLVLMDLEEARRKAKEAEAKGLYTYGLYEAGGTSWIYISEVPFTELGFSKVGSETPTAFNLRMLENVSIIGAVGLIALGGLWLYSKRRSRLEGAEKEEK